MAGGTAESKAAKFSRLASARVRRSPDEERIDYTSSEGDGRFWRPRKSGTLYRPGAKTPIEHP